MDEREFCYSTTQGFGLPPMSTTQIECEGHGKQHEGITQNFTNHLLHGEPLLAPGYEGINGLSLSNAMMLSTWKDKTVELPNDGEEFWEELQKRIASSRSKENVVEAVADLSGTYGNK